MTDNGRPRWRKGDDALLFALAAGQTIRDAAISAGLGEKTVYRRLANPAFRRRVADLRREMVAAAVGRLANAMAESADTLRSLLQATAESVRLGAAQALLELGYKMCEVAELEERIRNLEQSLTGKLLAEYTSN
jgi:hypothetical protein